MPSRIYILVLLIILLGGSTVMLIAQPAPSGIMEIKAHYTQEKIHLDGILDEEVWEQATRITGFTQRELHEGKPSTEKTEVAIVYTTKKLYVGVWCYDKEPDKIIAREMKRDFSVDLDDNFGFIIDTYNDKRNGFSFFINPNGARTDAQVLNNGNNVNLNWDGVWNARTKITAEGWFAEFEIPFSTLKFSTAIEHQTWGINFERNIRRRREQLLWQGWSRDYNINIVSQAGTLTGLDSIVRRDFIEIKPYVIGGYEQLNGSPTTSNSRFNAGGDINYLITPTVRANLTINTDFAQVESDLEQINLTRFPLFFPERREFFLEGQDYFDMGYGGNRVTPFYSRRIGLTDDRQVIPIVAGGRILGKVGDATLGAMSIQTGTKDTLPSTNYTIMSWRQDVLKQSTIGIMTVNKIENGRWHTTTGANAAYSTAKLFGDKNLNLSYTYVQTYNNDTTFNVDAAAMRFGAFYPNDKLFIVTSYQRSPEPFNPEVGLMRRRNFQEVFGMVRIKPRPKNRFKWIRQFDFVPGIVTYDFYNDTKALQSFAYEFVPMNFNTRSGETMHFRYIREAEGLEEDFVIRDAIVIPLGEYWQNRYNIGAKTFDSRVISGGLDVNWGEFFGGKSTVTEYYLKWRTNQYLNINAGYQKNWVNLPAGSFQTDLITTRIEYALNPNLFGALFAQWNNQDQLINLNFRLQWIPVIGANFFFIVNQRWDTKNRIISSRQTTVLGKLIWRFAI